MTKKSWYKKGDDKKGDDTILTKISLDREVTPDYLEMK